MFLQTSKMLDELGRNLEIKKLPTVAGNEKELNR
jgi:hypothetical protein